MNDRDYILNDKIPVCDRDGIIRIERERKSITHITMILLVVTIGIMCIAFARLV